MTPLIKVLSQKVDQVKDHHAPEYQWMSFGKIPLILSGI
jgi:hypothetical protein